VRNHLELVLGAVLSLLILVAAAVLDFIKHEPRNRYTMYSRSDTVRMFYLFLGLAGIEWTALLLLDFDVIPIPVIGWTLVLAMFALRIWMIQKDFVRRRTDVPNLLFRVTQYEFVLVVILLVGISYYVHGRRV
jgi:hypothetical protein